MDVRHKFDEQLEKILRKFSKNMNCREKLYKFLDETSQCIDKFQETRDLAVFDDLCNDDNKKTRQKKAAKENKSSDLLKTSSLEPPRREVLKNIEENIDLTSNVKTEVVVKQEMPPPAQPPKRGHKKKVVEVKKEVVVKMEKMRDSDVIMLMPHIETVDLTASNEVTNPNLESNAVEESRKTSTKKRSKEPVQTKTRSTRAARTKQKKQENDEKKSTKQASMSSVDEDALPSPTKSVNALASGDTSTALRNIHSPSKDKICTPPTEDIHTNPITEMTEAPSNETIIKTKTTPPLLNETITIQKAPAINETIILHKGPANRDDIALKDKLLQDKLMTGIEAKPNPQKKTALKPTSKQMFSPYGVSPVKKRVEAFEKLANTPPPMRITRTKTRKLNEGETQSKAEDVTQKVPKTSTASVTSSVIGSANRFNLRTTPGTQKKTNRFINTGDNISSKTLSAYKASQEEFREREKQRREREAEALQKKEALRQAQVEEKKRKREEKEQKAKEHREALELAEKQKALELQRQKEEKHKMNLLEKQEKLQKSKEEAEKKRLLIKQKREEKKREHEEKSKPIYMTQKIPLLPTYDCYDSDDEGAPDTRPPRPDWTTREKIHEKLKTKSFIATSYTNTFFCLKPQSPDLQEIFENIDPQKLVRKSSAVWSHNPRFTTCMPKINEEH